METRRPSVNTDGLPPVITPITILHSLMITKRLLLFSCLLLSAALLASGEIRAQSEFSTDRAMEHLRMLAGTIGPRPMGSPAERRAMEYALARLKEAGCQDTFLMQFTEAAGINTRSGIAVGVLKGETGRIIVIGGHIDSAGPDIPGANDDGSGSACVLEIARVLAQKPHHSTFVFCLWGGEEEGLRGSQYFVDHFQQLDSVALMLQVDMADGAGVLYPDPDGPYQVSSPRWLVDAAYDIFYNELHYSGLHYPTQFMTLNSASAGATGSDHDSFIKKGIPALDFTSDVQYPIHSPLDNLSQFQPSGLKRAGDLVVKLAERFDGGQPDGKTEKYWLVEAGHVPLFVPHWFIQGFAAASIVGAFWLAIVLFRRERRQQPPKVRWSGIKILAGTLLVNLFIWLSPDLVRVITGYRFPWAARFETFVLFGIVLGMIGFQLAFRWFVTMGISKRVALLFVRATILPLVLTLLCAVMDLELAIYPAAVLALFTLAVWLRRPWIGLVLLVLSLGVTYNFIFSEATGMFQRMMTWSMGMDGILAWAAYDGVYVLLFTVLSLPFAYAGAAYYRNLERGRVHLHRAALSPRTMLAFGAFAVIVFVMILVHKPYDASWTPAVRVQQNWSRLDSTATVRITASEPLRNAVARWEGKDTTGTGRQTELQLPGGRFSPEAWCSVQSSDTILTRSDSTVTVTRTLAIRTPVRPLTMTVSFDSRTPFDAVSPWIMGARHALRGGLTERHKVLTWYSFPDTLSVVPVTFTVKEGQSIKQNVEVTFDTLATPVTIDNAPGYVTKRMTVTVEDSMRVAGTSVGVAEANR